MPNIRLLIAEDECITRMAFTQLLASYPNFNIIGGVGNGNDLIEKYKEVRPDVVLCDISMPIMNGLDASDKILNHDRYAKIILLTMHSEKEYLFGAIKIGVLGYVTKSISEGDLRYAIQSVHDGGTYYMGKTEEEIEEIKSRCCNGKMDSKYDELTKREKEILSLVADGMTSEEISKNFSLSKRTVDNHRYSIKEKTGLTRRSEIVDLLRKTQQFRRAN